MKRPSLCPLFFMALLFTLCSTAVMPSYGWLSFSPFLIFAFNQCSFSKALYLASVCGLVIDMLSNRTLFGHHALIYVLVTCCLYRLRLFFPEKPLGISLFTVVFSLLATTIERCGLLFLCMGIPLAWEGVKSDFCIMPLLDGLYAFLCFSCPLIAYNYLRRQWFRFLFFIKGTKKEEKKPRGRSFDR